VTPSLTVYRALHLPARLLCRLYFRLEVVGAGNVPASGPFVVAPVHRSNVDFMLVAMITRRRLRFMAKDSLWRVPLLRGLVEVLGAFPVERGSPDRQALRRCLEVLEAGEPLVVFPEGTRKEGPQVGELFEGAAYLSIRAGVPIVPVGIGGSAAAMPRGARTVRPARVRVVVGPPILPPGPGGGRAPRSAVHQLTARLRSVLQALFDQAEGRSPGGQG
jgi:1-acyl-sn-glycerol-3-phosphate acyltransferase